MPNKYINGIIIPSFVFPCDGVYINDNASFPPITDGTSTPNLNWTDNNLCVSSKDVKNGDLEVAGKKKSSKSKKVSKKMPDNWNVVSKTLLSAERNLYEKESIDEVIEKRNGLCSYYDRIFLGRDRFTEEQNNIFGAAWLFIRLIYLESITAKRLCKPSIEEVIISCANTLIEDIRSLELDVKKSIDQKLSKYTKVSRPLSLKEREEGIFKLINEMLIEVEDKRKIQAGGVSSKKTRSIARRLKNKVLTAYENPTKSKEIG